MVQANLLRFIPTPGTVIPANCDRQGGTSRPCRHRECEADGQGDGLQGRFPPVAPFHARRRFAEEPRRRTRLPSVYFDPRWGTTLERLLGRIEEAEIGDPNESVACSVWPDRNGSAGCSVSNVAWEGRRSRRIRRLRSGGEPRGLGIRATAIDGHHGLLVRPVPRPISQTGRRAASTNQAVKIARSAHYLPCDSVVFRSHRAKSARSGGSGVSKCIASPVTGCAKPSSTAHSAMRGTPLVSG